MFINVPKFYSDSVSSKGGFKRTVVLEDQIEEVV